MIEWIPLNQQKPKEINKSYLVTDGKNVTYADYNLNEYLGEEEPQWYVYDIVLGGKEAVRDITHYAEITVPKDK